MNGWSEQRALPFVLMRGGTSKAVFLRDEVLPRGPAGRDQTILELFGSPDPRQVDGLGGADLLTSKLAIIGEATRPDADLDYTFAQVSITEPVVDYDINCGNISAAVGAYAVDEGIVPVTGPETTVRIHNTNTGRVFVATVPVIDGHAAVEGDTTIDGVPGEGASIALDYCETAGGTTGDLFPTGNTVDLVEIDSGRVEVSIVDLANLCVFVNAEAIGMTGTEGPADFAPRHLEALAVIKAASAALVGVTPDGLVPIPVVVSAPAAFTSYGTGVPVQAGDIDLVARVVGGRPPVVHKAYPGTVGACTGVASVVTGTVPHQVTKQQVEGRIVVGHPSGVMPVLATARVEGNRWHVEQAAYTRTARRLAAGSAYLRRSKIPTE